MGNQASTNGTHELEVGKGKIFIETGRPITSEDALNIFKVFLFDSLFFFFFQFVEKFVSFFFTFFFSSFSK